jgi:hypothetical protein
MGGITRYHTVALIVPLMAVLSHAILGFLPLPPGPIKSLVVGGVVTLLSFFVFEYAPIVGENYALGKALVLGLITAKTFMFHEPQGVPSASSIALFMFLYLKSAEGPSEAGSGRVRPSEAE